MTHKLLLADDSVTIQRVIELTFADEDVQVVAVGDGKKAIEAVQASRPDIVLADVGMPERDGYEVAAFIKGNPEFAHIPVLLLTGAFEPIDETRARAVGCDGVLVKPFEPQMVINRVKDLLAGRRHAGLWSANPAAQTPSRPAAQPRAEFASALPAPASSSPASGPAGNSLEDYFDRLDAAFASLDGGAPASAGMGSASPETAQPARSVSMPPARDFDWQATPPPASHGVPGHGASAAGDDLAGWDPDLTGDPTRPAPLEPPPIEIDPQTYAAPAASWTPSHASESHAPGDAAPGHAPTAAASSAAAALPEESRFAPATFAPAPSSASMPSAALPAPSLAEAFAALLSAEQHMTFAPSSVRPAGGGVSESMIEDVVRRAVARMTEQAVKDSVVEVAERLVREEIERIKGR